MNYFLKVGVLTYFCRSVNNTVLVYNTVQYITRSGFLKMVIAMDCKILHYQFTMGTEKSDAIIDFISPRTSLKLLL